MKNKITPLFILCFLFSLTITAQTERKSSYNIGFDPITGFYVGFDYRINDYYSIGLDGGSSFDLVLPSNITLILDNSFYFGKPNRYNLKTWHVDVRTAYSKILVDNKPNLLHVIPSIGKTFYLNKELGFDIGIGYGFQVLKDFGKPLIGEGFIAHDFSGAFYPSVRLEFKF